MTMQFDLSDEQQALQDAIERLLRNSYVTRIAAGAGVGLADAGHTWALQREDVIAVPLAEEEHVTTFVLHKHQRFGIAEPLQRFLAYVSTLS